MKHIVKSLFFNHDFVLENGFNVHVLIADLTADTDFSYQVDNGLTPIRVMGLKSFPFQVVWGGVIRVGVNFSSDMPRTPQQFDVLAATLGNMR